MFLGTLNARAMALRVWRHRSCQVVCKCTHDLEGLQVLLDQVEEWVNGDHKQGARERASLQHTCEGSVKPGDQTFVVQVHFTALVNRGDKIEEPSGQPSGTKTKHEIFVGKWVM